MLYSCNDLLHTARPDAMIDLPAYFARIGHTGSTEPTLGVLRDLAARHLTRIPFEGLDPFLGVPVDLDPAAVQGKLIGARRGGYCHEHNALFHDVLADLAFSVSALGGRVVWAFKGQRAPLTHRLTLVELPEGRFFVDVGFGGQSPSEPLRLEPGPEQATPHGTYRVERDGETYELQLRLEGRWEAMYQFTLAPQAPMDFEVANWFTSTHPRSLFTQNLVVCRIVGETRVNLLNTGLAVRQPDGRVEQRTLANADELGQVLEDVMGLDLPAPVEAIWAKAVRQS
jgi:N-hydroxyarylamine O-acetyltransferase